MFWLNLSNDSLLGYQEWPYASGHSQPDCLEVFLRGAIHVLFLLMETYEITLCFPSVGSVVIVEVKAQQIVLW